MTKLTAFADALATVRAAARPLGHEEVPLINAAGRILAVDTMSRCDVPRFANSAMDGFAVLSSATPGRFVVASRLVAGHEADAHVVTAARAVEIMTGAPLPHGADAVVKIEDVETNGGETNSGETNSGEVSTPAVPKWNNVRAAGEDYREGALVAARGTRLSPEHLLALAQTGSGSANVCKQPRVAIVPTGLELQPPGTQLRGAASIWNSSAVYLASALTGVGCQPTLFPIVADDEAQFQATMQDALRAHDIVVSTGAVSMGVHDFIPSSLDKMGARTHFRKLAIRPAKPVVFAEKEGRLIFALPGNPISTVVAFRFLVWPSIARMLGLPDERPVTLALRTDTKKPSGMRCFFKAQRDDTGVSVTTGQGSHLVHSLVAANAWVVLGEEGDCMKAGAPVDVYTQQPAFIT